MGGDVVDAHPRALTLSPDVQVQEALVLLLGARHGKMGATLSAQRLGIGKVDLLVDEGDTAAGTACEIGRAVARRLRVA